MDIKKLDRTALKSYFVKNAIPTAGNFADLIDGIINQKEDGIVKLAGEPLSVQADGNDTSQKKAINFYKNFADPRPAWTLSLNPRVDPNNPATAKPGWSIGDADGNSKLFIDQTTGNIGVATVEPGGYKLNVNGPALFTGNYLYVNSESAGRLRVGAAWGMPGLYSSDDGAKPLTLGVPAGQKVYLGTSTADAFVEGGTGNAYFKGTVGIGTAAPTHQFHVVANDAVGLFESTGTQAYLRLSTKEGINNRVEITNRPGGRLSLWTAGGGDVLNITKDGSVGIGTTSPQAKLDVIGAIRAGNSDIYFTETNHNHTGIGNTAGYAAIENATNYGALMILGRNTSVNRVVKLWDYLQVNGGLDVTGNVGIGGNVRAPNFIGSLMSNNGRYVLIMQDDRNLVMYTVGGGAFWASNTVASDINLKRDLKPLSNALEKLQSLRGIAFSWKEEAMGKGEQIGVIAQEVEKVFPELVSSISERKFVNYQGLIPVLIEAVKEQQARIGDLRAEVQALRGAN